MRHGGARGRTSTGMARGMKNPRRTTCLLAALALPCLPLTAATWTGAGDGWSWSNLENWEDGVLPSAGEAVWIKPVAGNGWVEIGGVAGGDPINLVIESPIGLDLMLNPEARVAGVTTLDAGWHRLGGNPPEASSSWEVAAGGSLVLGSLATGSNLVKTGQGTLTISSAASGAGQLRVAGLEGGVVIEAEHAGDLSEATLEALGASFSFAGNVTRVGKLVIGEGSFGPMAGGRLVAGEVVIRRSGDLDLSNLPGITTGVLRVEGGTVIPSGSLEAGRIVVANAMLGLGPSSLGGVVELKGGWIDSGVLTGEVLVDTAAGMSGWMGIGYLTDGARLTWMPTEDGATALGLTGELVFEEGSLLAIGEADWSSPYWDATRTVTLVETWGVGIVRGMPTLEGGGVEGQGSWTLGDNGQGGLALTWAVEAVPVPEPSTWGWAALVLLTGAWRRRVGTGNGN